MSNNCFIQTLTLMGLSVRLLLFFTRMILVLHNVITIMFTFHNMYQGKYMFYLGVPYSVLLLFHLK